MAKKGKGAPQMVVTSRVKEVIKAAKLRASGDLIDAVNESLLATLQEAARRAKTNGRGTVRPHDL
jgi:hypothetical protein